jgi:pectate lyase
LDDRDAFQILNARNVILDHVSAGWSVDEAVSTWFPNVENVTIQNSIIAEALRDAGHG